MSNITSAEHAAASVMSFMGQTSHEKREREGEQYNNPGDDAAGFVRPVKIARGADGGRSTPTFETPSAATAGAAVPAKQRVVREMKPYPFFFYRDHSLETDDDPLTPLTPPGRVPNFPAKVR